MESFSKDGVTHTVDRPFFIVWWMSYFDFRALTTPWDVVYYASLDVMNMDSVVKHEQCHVEQMRREGKMTFLFRYCLAWYRYGYVNNPYEIEARDASEKIIKDNDEK